jgi:hypothetical protein
MSRTRKRRSTLRSWSFASYYLFCNNLIRLRSEYDFLSKKHRWSMTKKAKARNVLISKKTTTSCRTVIARMSISIRRSSETSRTIYCAERTSDTFLQNFSKENFWSKIMMTRTLIISSTKEFSICWKENIFETTWARTQEYVDTCSTCHRIKFVRHKSHDLLQSFSIFERSRQDWTMNFITDLSFSKHREVVYDSMLMMIDRYIKFNLYISSKKTWNAENLTNALIDEIFIKFEKLVFIVTDRDFLFTFKYWSSLCYHLWIRLRYNIAYHSQIDEQIERQNQTFESYLRNYVNYQQNDWVKWFNIAEYVYNNNLNNVLKQTFFQMMFDSEMRFENVIQKDLKIDVFAARDRVVHVSKMRRACEARWKQTLKRAKRNYNKKKVQIEFKINDKIFLNAKNIISMRSFKKLN